MNGNVIFVSTNNQNKKVNYKQIERIFYMKQIFSALIFGALSLCASSAFAQVGAQADTKALLDQLKQGGMVIVLRHGGTNADQADIDPLNHDNVAKQRLLTDKGRADAKTLAEVFKKAHVPISKVMSSKLYRAIETARIVSGKDPEALIDVNEGGLVVSPNENNRRAKAFRDMAAVTPAKGTNTFIVSHKPNIIDAFGKDWFEIKEGEASIFKSDGNGKAILVARVLIADWAK